MKNLGYSVYMIRGHCIITHIHAHEISVYPLCFARNEKETRKKESEIQKNVRNTLASYYHGYDD